MQKSSFNCTCINYLLFINNYINIIYIKIELAALNDFFSLEGKYKNVIFT